MLPAKLFFRFSFRGIKDKARKAEKAPPPSARQDTSPSARIYLQAPPHTAQPVSYTHLDVYKRQKLYLEFGWIVSDPTVWKSMKRLRIHGYTRRRKATATGTNLEHIRYALSLIHIFRFDDYNYTVILYGTLYLRNFRKHSNHAGLRTYMKVYRYCLLYTSRCV